MRLRHCVPLGVLLCLPCGGVDPTFLRRHLPGVAAQPDGYRAAFGAGDADARQLKGITRFGELALGAGQTSAACTRDGEEQIVVALDGTGTAIYAGEPLALKRYDYLYIPPGVPHSFAAQTPLRLLLMGFRAPAGNAPAKPQRANLEDVPLTQVASHPPTTLYRLLLGQTTSRRDRLACARSVTSLFVMEFAPGGTNIPHHHETEEEIYYVLAGHGQMVAGGGVDGVENRLPTRAGDAWFFRLNTTVGFYSETGPGEPPARILAVRSLFPFPKR